MNPRHCLVVAPAWVGDMVMSGVVYARLRAAGAERIDVVAPVATAEIAARLPGIDDVFALPVGHGELGLARRWQLGRSLRGRYDLALVLPGSWKSALVPWVAGVPRRRGWLGEQRYGLLNDLRRLDPSAYPRMVDRYAALASDDWCPGEVAPPKLVARSAAALRVRFDLAGQGPVVALCPGAEFGPAKRWPAQMFGALAKRLAGEGIETWVIGGPRDAHAGREIRSAAPSAVDLTGRTRLAEAIDLLASAAVVVSNDSGLMHVAAALDRPLVAIFGSSSPDFTPPLAETVAILRRDLDCAPCFERRCPLGHLRCLKDIAPEAVHAKVLELL